MLTEKQLEIMEDCLESFLSNSTKIQREIITDYIFPGFFELSLEKIDEIHKDLFPED